MGNVTQETLDQILKIQQTKNQAFGIQESKSR